MQCLDADFDRADLRHAKLTRSRGRASFRGSELAFADFRLAALQGCDFDGADLHGPTSATPPSSAAASPPASSTQHSPLARMSIPGLSLDVPFAWRLDARRPRYDGTTAARGGGSALEGHEWA